MTGTRTYSVTIDIELTSLRGYSDAYLVAAWHAAQANPADGFDQKGPGELAEHIGREIIRRRLQGVDPEMWHHQGQHYYWKQLTGLGHWEEGTFVPDTPPTTDPTAPDGSGATAAVAAKGGAV